ncbi:MAG TPA: hypothetical protein VIK55_06435 [Paludibacter sp.]
MAKKQTGSNARDTMLINAFRSLVEIGQIVEVEAYKEVLRQTKAKAKKEMGCDFSIKITNEKKVTAIIKRES